jgi:hypothetical protein
MDRHIAGERRSGLSGRCSPGDWTPLDFQKPDPVFEIGVEPRRIDILTGLEAIDFPKHGNAGFS